MSAARVLHLIGAPDLGGAERQVIEIVRGLDRSRFEPTVGCLVRKGPWAEALEADGIRVVDFAKRSGFDLGFVFRLTRFIGQGGFEIVHTHAFTAASWGRVAATLAGTPVVVAHEHSAFSLESTLRRAVDRMLSAATSKWVVVSEALARDLVRAEGLPLSRVVVVPGSVSERTADVVGAIESLYTDLLAPPGSPRARLKRPKRASSLRRAVRRSVALVSPTGDRREGPRLRILAYHRVNDRHPGDRLSVHPLEFRRQMEYVAESGRPVLPLPEAVRRLRGEGSPLPRGALCLTFDDGYRDNLEHAAPILEHFGFRATVFLVTEHMGAFAAIDRYEGCCEHDQALTWDEARELRARGHTLGGHGRSHRELARLDEAAARDEILGCRADLATELGTPPTAFCYPRGSEDAAVRRAVADAGFEVAVTVYPGANAPDADALRLHRTEISGDDRMPDFRLKLHGAFDGWHRLWQRVQPAANGSQV